jgi:hypothetical protein
MMATSANNYPMEISVAIVVMCLLVIAILWLPDILGKD